MSSRPADAGASVLVEGCRRRSPDDASAVSGPAASAAAAADDFSSAAAGPGAASAAVAESGEFSFLQTAIRASVPLVVGAYLVDSRPIDSLTASAWSAIYSWGPAHAPLFEADVASLGFFTSIAFFSCLHLVLGPERTRASRLDGKLPTKPLEWAERKNFHLWFNPLASYLGSIWIFHRFIHEKAPLPAAAPTFGAFACELLFGIFLYDLCFFPIHWLMHKSSWGQLRRVHGYHHRVSSHALNSLETVQHSYLDGFLQVAVNVLVQQVSPFGGFGRKHAMSRLSHNLVVTYLLSEAHSGYDLWWMSHRLFPEILGGAPRHEGHHHDCRVYYQQFFMYIDDSFGFTDAGVRGKASSQGVIPSGAEDADWTGNPVRKVPLSSRGDRIAKEF